jgi:hypothetical protein
VDINQPVSTPPIIETVQSERMPTLDPRSTTVPVTWTDLQLSGRLVYNTATNAGDAFISETRCNPPVFLK